MAQKPVLSAHLKEQHAALREILDATLDLAEKSQEVESLQTLRERRKNLESAALFVVVGEVKAGKSSFINALLGEEICKVAPDPCTAVIQELTYGETRLETNLGQFWQRVQLPKDVLREITIVDTPGTNSIIRNHQTITENYIPQSDLVIFVFPAKNPHTATAWDMLSLIRKEWHRKVVFILQQADLATQNEISINRDRVVQYARERNVQNVVIFTVSATREIDGASDSGFAEFRDFIRKAVETGDVWRMKFEGARDTARKILSSILERLSTEEASFADDRAFYQGLIARVASRREKANNLKRLVVDNLCNTYDTLTNHLQQDFTSGLSVGTIFRRSIPVIRDKDLKTWLKDLQAEFEKNASVQIEADAQRVSKDLSDEMQAMLDELTQDIRHRQQRLESNFEKIGAERADLLDRLRGKLHGLRIVDIVGEKGLQGSDLGTLTLAGGGLAALGAVIAWVTQLAMFDITGGVLATLGAALVAVTLLWKRNSIFGELSRKLAQSRQDFRHRLDNEITSMFEKLFHEVEHLVTEPLREITNKAARLQPLMEQARTLLERTNTLI